MKIIFLTIILLIGLFKAFELMLKDDERRRIYELALENLEKYSNYTIPFFHKTVALSILKIYKKTFKNLVGVNGLLRFSLFSCCLTFACSSIGNTLQYSTPMGYEKYYSTPKSLMIIPLVFLINIPFDFLTTLVTKRHLFIIIKKPNYSNIIFRVILDLFLALILAFLCGMSLDLAIKLNNQGFSLEILYGSMTEFFRHTLGILGLKHEEYSFSYLFYIGTTLIPTILYLLYLLVLVHFRYVSIVCKDIYLRVLENGTNEDYKKLKIFSVFAIAILAPIGGIVGLIIEIIK